jgi:selenide,water dikinase
MNTAPDIPLKDLVLIGGGHAHVHVLKMLGMNSSLPHVRVTLITRDICTPYSGMLPGYVAGVYSREECHIDLSLLCSFGGVRMFHTEVNGIDTENKMIFCSDGRPPISYDIVSLNIGITPKSLPMFADRKPPSITPVKPIDSFCAKWDKILARVLSLSTTDFACQSSKKPITICVVGGGGTGCIP